MNPIRHALVAAAAASLPFIAPPAQAALRVFACEPEWGALTQALGGNLVVVAGATTAVLDPPQIQAKPSLIARTRNAELVVCTGAELEIGWLPVLLQESGNPKVRPGAPGYFEATAGLRLLEIPSAVDRAMGDVHPEGNPHVQLDPHNIAAIAQHLSARLAQIDPANADYYAQRGKDFQARWQQAIEHWTTEAAPLKDLTVVVIHKDQTYLCRWLGLNQVAAIEPKPGVPPSAGYLADLVKTLSSAPPKLILRNAYNDPKAAEWLSERIHAPVVLLPFSVGGTPGAKDLFGLYDDTITRLLGALK